MVDAKTFDLAAVFSGNAFPKDTVDVYLNEEIAYRIHGINKELGKPDTLSDEGKVKKLQDDLKALAKKAEESHYVIHLTGVSRQDRKGALAEALEKYPAETDAFGRTKQDAKANEFLSNLVWKLHVEKIVNPEGAELEPSLEDIIIFRDNAPDSVIDAVEAGIAELSEGVKSGFETIVQEHDFLSQP